MKLTVFSSAYIVKKNGQNFIYAPYLNEMKIWSKYVDEIEFCCPVTTKYENMLLGNLDDLHCKYSISQVREFNILNFKSSLKAIYNVLFNLVVIFKVMRCSQHIHLRCPGNNTLLACFIQMLFPNKIKTAKYAGNWDFKSKQPLSYIFQKKILSNTFLTRNITVLVYGEWPNSTKNIKSFFTATYTENEKREVEIRRLNSTIKFMFVGTLSQGKRPLYAIQLLEKLYKKGFNVELSIFGNGAELESLNKYVVENQCEKYVLFKGNQSQEIIKQAYIEHHFLLLPSKSEGWPKVVAEAMFWANVPISTNISCVSSMLNNEQRGILLSLNLAEDVQKIVEVLNNDALYKSKAEKALIWSRKYTLDYFESEIKALL